MRGMAAYPAYRVSVRASVDDLAAKTRADVASHGGVVLVGRRGRQSRQLRRVHAAVRDGYRTHYFSADAGPHLLTVEAVEAAPSRAIGWWGTAG